MNTSKLFVLSFLFLLSTFVFSQTEKEISHYLFPEFINGTVLMKNGTKNHALLNYNIATKEMIFDQNGQKLAIAKPTLNAIDSVFINDRIFIRQNNMFMEVLIRSPFQLLSEYNCKVLPPPKPSAYGGKSETSSIDTYSSWQTDGRVYNLQLPDDFKIKPYTVYWLKKNGKLKSFASLKQIKNFYRKNKNEIKLYEKTNEIKFENADAITRFISYLESLKEQ